MILGRDWLAGAIDPYEGRAIVSIEFDPPNQALSRESLSALLPVKVGQPLRATDVRAALQRLYATGEFADISADVTSKEGAVVLRFITKPNYFIGSVSAVGVPEPPSEGQLVTTAKLQLGAQFNEHDVTQAVESLDEVLKRNGFYKSTITPEIDRDETAHQVKIRFVIDPGSRARFDGIEITGNSIRPEASVIRSTGWKPLRGWLPWRPLTEDRLHTGLEGIRAWYQKHNHLLANTTLSRIDYREDDNRVTPAINIDAGPKVIVNVSGARLSGARLRTLLPIYQERALDKDLLVEGQRNLIAYMLSRGYFEAKVEVETDTETNGDESVDYHVIRGSRHRLAVLGFSGNKYFNAEVLRERMVLLPSSFLRFRYGRFSHEYLEKDLNAIRELYRSNGFRDVDVTAREIDDYKGKPDDIAVFIDIKEGPQSFVAQLELAGVPDADQRYLRSILHSTEGQPYSEYNVATDRDSVLEFYFNNGHPNAKFEFTSTPSAEPNRIDLRFRIDPGERETVRGVLINGLDRTRDSLVKDRITLKPGDPLSQTLITESQRRLYDLGIFAKVNSALQNPEGDEPSKYVLYSIEEARRYSINTGFGAEIARIGGGATTLDSPAGTTGFSPRLSLGVNRLNFLGLGHTIGLQTRVSTLQQRALFTYLTPQFLGSPNFSLQFSGLFDISKDVRTFSARREEGTVQLARKLSKANTLQFRYTFRKVNILGTPLVTPELIPLLSQPVRVGLVGASFVQDRRDDPTDAHRGVYNTLDFSFATSALGSQTGFGRVVARNATYHRVNKSITLARSTTFGIIDRYAGLLEIPLAERFFSGGSSSLRAFPDNQAGPRDLKTGFPIGGNALFMNSVEARFPLIGDNIGGVLFNDLGNVYSGVGNISLRWKQRSLSDFDYAVQSFGFGIRYKTPIGPVRVDLSVSPNSPRFFGFKGSLNELLFGGGAAVVQRINMFQFHFSLGQAF